MNSSAVRNKTAPGWGGKKRRFIGQVARVAVSTGGSAIKAVTFDGTNDYMTRGADLDGATDGQQGMFSCWIMLGGGDSAAQELVRVVNAQVTVWISRTAGNLFQMVMSTVAGVNLILTTTVNQYTADATWRHVLMSWNTTASPVAQIYITDVSDDTDVGAPAEGTIDYNGTDWGIGAVATTGANKLNADIAELYLNLATNLDFSTEANRRLFISATGKPVDLGADGSTPTGTAPIVYQSVRSGDAATAFATNRGTGGNFSITGTLAIAATSPSD